MAKITFDVSGVEAGFKQPVPGMYRAAITDETKVGKSRAGNDQIAVVLKISEGKFKGAKLWSYVPLNSDTDMGKVRLKQFLLAVGAVGDKKQSGSLDTDKLVGQEIQVRVEADEYEGQYKPKVSGLYEIRETEDEESFDDPNETAASKSSESEASEGEDFEIEAGSPNDSKKDDEEESYSDWALSELKEELEERELSPKGRKTDLIARLEEDDADSLEVPF